MRMITHDVVHHNAPSPARRAILGIAPLVLILALAACSGDAGKTDSGRTAAATGEDTCAVIIDASAWTAFKALADRVDAGEDVPREDFFEYSRIPSVTQWILSLDSRAPNADRVAHWAEGVFWEKLGRQGKQKRSQDRSSFMFNSNFSLDNRRLIDTRLEHLAGPGKCELDSLIRYWIDPEKLPDTIALHFLPARPEIRIVEGNLFVDTGVLAAGSEGQVTRNAAALLYRSYQSIPGPNPMEVEGELALAHAFRILANEGVVGWIDKAAHLEFSKDHPTLFKVNLVPEEFFLKAQEAIGLMNRQLGKMLDDEADMAKRGRVFAEHLAAMNAYSQTGYGMSAVISHRLGEDRLKQVSRSVPDFLAAYQEAALQNPSPAPLPGKPGVRLPDTVPPLDPEIFTKLHALLSLTFPD